MWKRRALHANTVALSLSFSSSLHLFSLKYVSSNDLYAFMHIVLIFHCVCVASRLLWPLPIMLLLCYISSALFFLFAFVRLKNISLVPLNVGALISLSLSLLHCVCLCAFFSSCCWCFFSSNFGSDLCFYSRNLSSIRLSTSINVFVHTIRWWYHSRNRKKKIMQRKQSIFVQCMLMTVLGFVFAWIFNFS